MNESLRKTIDLALQQQAAIDRIMADRENRRDWDEAETAAIIGADDWDARRPREASQRRRVPSVAELLRRSREPAPVPYTPLVKFDAAAVGDRSVAPRQWIVDGWLPIGRVTLLYGDGGTGKTTVAQQLMTACETGHPWFGLPVMRCKTVALFCEDDIDEIHQRQERINRHLGIAMSDLGETEWFAGIGADNVLMTFDRNAIGTLTDRFHDLHYRAMVEQARLVVIDASAGTFGGNEIDRAQVSKFVGQALTQLAIDIRGAVLLLAHPSRSGMAVGGSKDSGSTGWNNSSRSRWSFVRPVVDGVADEDARVLTLEKSNWARRGANINVRWIDGVFAPPNGGGLAGAFEAVSRQQNAERVFLELLAKFDRPLSSSSASAGNYAPKLFSKRPDGEGFSKREFEKAMHALMARRVIVDRAYGRPSDLRHRIALAGVDPETGEIEATDE